MASDGLSCDPMQANDRYLADRSPHSPVGGLSRLQTFAPYHSPHQPLIGVRQTFSLVCATQRLLPVVTVSTVVKPI